MSLTISEEGKEAADMNYMDFDPHLIRECNEQIRREVNSLRLEERLGEDGRPPAHGSGFFAFARRGVVPLLRAARLAR